MYSEKISIPRIKDFKDAYSQSDFGVFEDRVDRSVATTINKFYFIRAKIFFKCW